MTTVKLFNKGTEDIFYDQVEGDTIVLYYLICESDQNGSVLRSCSFAYSPEHDTYFSMNDDDRRKQIETIIDADAYDVALESASVEDECRLSTIMEVNEDNEIFNVWMNFHRTEFPYLYETNE